METRIDRIERYIEEFANGMLELKESQKKTDAQQNRTRQTEELLQATIKEFRVTQKSLGDLGLVQGEVAEELFYRNVKGLFRPLDLRSQTSDGGAALLNRKDFRPKEFS